jgi:SPP1 family holin
MDTGSVVRTLLLVVTLVNQVLTVSGHTPIPLGEAEANALSVSATVIVSLWTWWKNNYISKKGLLQKEVLKDHGLTK